MNNIQIRYQFKKLKDFLAIKTEMVDHRSVIRDVALGVDRSWIYYLMLLMSGLIALLGLLTNSVAVVIGAMLISPLMGPIISSSLALTISDLPLARRAFRTIAISVVLTILISAVVTMISPLKEPTAEIMARVRPNIYDLFVAVLSGIVGAVALCTKRNYVVTATGVAVATAVIPPLSVVGYAVGTGQIMLALGGFLLFFTNFVAIVLTSDLVFFIMGFRSSHVETVQYSQRTRLAIISGVLMFISIPLVYTLIVDVKKVKDKKRIESVLKKYLNKNRKSRMTGYTYQLLEGKLLVMPTVNTVDFIKVQTRQQIEAELRDNFKTPVDLQLEQVLVASEKLPLQSSQSLIMPGADKPTVPDISVEISAKVGKMAARAEKELADAFAPFPVSETRLIFSTGVEPLQIITKLGRDYPVSEDERLLLSRMLQKKLELPVNLAVAVTSFLPKLEFAADGALAPQSITSLAVMKTLPGGYSGFRFLLESSGKKNSRELAGVKRYLMYDLGIDAAAISVHSIPKAAVVTEGITLRIARR